MLITWTLHPPPANPTFGLNGAPFCGDSHPALLVDKKKACRQACSTCSHGDTNPPQNG